MSGMGYIIIGIVILAVGTVGVAVLEIFLARKKRLIREQYQIYD